MRITPAALGLLSLAAAAPALADEPTAPPPALTFNATASIVSDYRFRGISQTDKNFAVQGSLTVTHVSGFYASVWGSSVDGYVTAAGDFYRPAAQRTACCTAHQEIDLIAGFKKTYGGTTFDVGALYYYYPKTKAPGDPTSTDFIEPYADIAHTFGPVTAKATINYAPKQKALRLDQATGQNRDNVYLAGDLSASIPKTPLGLTAHLGHTFGPSWLASDANGKKEYTDWGLGATLTYKQFSVGVTYVDTDATFLTYSGKNASKGGVVGNVTVSF